MSQQQQTIADQTLFYTRIVERYAHFFERPEVRLRFLNRTLAKQIARRERLQQRTHLLAFLKRLGVEDWLLEIELHRQILEELNNLLPTASEEAGRFIRHHKAPFAARLCFSFYRTRRVFYAGGLAILMFALFGLYSMATWSVRHANTYLAQHYRTTPIWPTAPSTPSITTAQAAEGTKYLPDYRPEKVWLVERTDSYERYSNGGRIMTGYETGTRARGYYQIQRSANLTAAAGSSSPHREPVGILYHTSESDLIPFTAANNTTIETRTRELLEYVQRHKSYNYLIDRYGQIYRIVRDDQVADHAGHSIWADQQNIYVGLNESFLGVSFETRTEAGADEQLTEAQLIAGRLLTAILRSRYQIDDTNCVTHGLVSVNPGNMLIGYHHDWVRNFPFEAMGLSDKYKVAPASVSEFGFTYDGELVARLGGVMWPGVEAAQGEFQRRADKAGLKPEDLRLRMREFYRDQMDLTGKLRHEAPVATAATATSAREETEASLAHRQAAQSKTGN
ncbi:MAG TPA: peptidoglycan recognition family protein [Pyrinomonadaceae bacterium]|jgi:hypothetical protein|nr:peptidoglycan recognition family protein [Pyrinomonadaceae bacterium]